jgi:transcriptional regulator of nitric oxide reductase
VNAPEQPETVADRLRQLDCDPIAGMAKLAQDETVPAVLRARMFAELATYIVPRRKATDLTGVDGKPLDMEFGFNRDALTDQELEILHDLLIKTAT